jgi:hypothetical protein
MSLLFCGAALNLNQLSKEGETMCDYSLAGIPNRLAVEGEQLTVHRFSTGSLGLASPSIPLARLCSAKESPAVCVPPGARLLLRDVPEDLQRQFGVGATEEVTFVQLSVTAYQYRDALRFKNGREILLQKLRCGQQVDVQYLSSGDFQEAEHQKLEEEYGRVFYTLRRRAHKEPASATRASA